MTDSPGRSKAHTRTRNASCLSLSPDGRLLAVGEVRLRSDGCHYLRLKGLEWLQPETQHLFYIRRCIT